MLNAVNTSMDCIFSVAHDRWFMIRPSDCPPQPIDNSSIKIRAAGKLYDPTSKYSNENLLDSFVFNCNREEKRLSFSDRSEETGGELAENISDELAADVDIVDDSTAVLEDTIDYDAKIKEKLDNFQFNRITTERFTYESKNFTPKSIFATTTPGDVSLDDTLNDNGKQIDAGSVSNDTLDVSEEGNFGNDLIPPPSEFASEMNPLRKSKSAPAPFQKAKKGAYPSHFGHVLLMLV